MQVNFQQMLELYFLILELTVKVCYCMLEGHTEIIKIVQILAEAGIKPGTLKLEHRDLLCANHAATYEILK